MDITYTSTDFHNFLKSLPPDHRFKSYSKMGYSSSCTYSSESNWFYEFALYLQKLGRIPDDVNLSLSCSITNMSYLCGSDSCEMLHAGQYFYVKGDSVRTKWLIYYWYSQMKKAGYRKFLLTPDNLLDIFIIAYKNTFVKTIPLDF